jgi:hypothetical protein
MALSGDLAERDIKAALAQAENRVAFAREIKISSLKITGARDWVDMGGKPYLQASGAEKLCWLWGIYWKDLHIEPTLSEAVRLFKENEAVSFEVIGVVGSRTLGLELVIYGGRSSEDEFFTTRWEGQGQSRHKVQRPMSQVDVLDVRKSAVTNWIANAVTRLLGLRGMAWDELKAHGIQPGGRVDFKSKAQPPQSQGAEAARPIPPPPAATPQEDNLPDSNDISISEMRDSIVARLTREEKDPDKAINALTKGHVANLKGLDDAPDKYIRSLFDRMFPADGAD